uniref:Pyridoxal-dependent decarboxylase domain-containing protein 1 n=1 Tax=Astatotilapia calliptera TaxID=8154 RepID=A0AAX7TQ24_ASTCA
MVDSTLDQVGKNLSEAMRFLGEEQREPEAATERQHFSRSCIPGPLQGDGQDVATVLRLVHNLIHEEEDEEDKPSQKMQNVGEHGQMALLGHSLAAYISMMDKEQLRKLTTRIQSDTTLWLCRLFRYENGSTCFHEDDRDGLVKVCRLVINARYEEYATEGYVVLNTRQPVIYQSASCRPGLGQHLCSQDVALLEKLIKEDINAGKLPLLLIANAGTPGAGHTDKLGRLKELCDQYNMWLHVEGVNLATLALGQVTSSIMAATRSDSMTLTPGPWLGLPAVTAVTLYRHEDPALSLAAGLTSSHPVEKLRALPLWLSLQYLGHNGIVQKIKHATTLSQLFLQKVQSLTCIKTLVEDESDSPVVLFKFNQEESIASSESFCAGEKEVLDAFNRWLGEELAELVPTSGIDVVELEDEATCVRFSPLLTAAVLGTREEDVESIVEKMTELVFVMSSTMSLREDFREETHKRSPSLRYINEFAWPGLGVVRYEMQANGMDEDRKKQEQEKINTELLKKLQDLDTDILFSTGPEFVTEQGCIFVGMVTDDVDVSDLVDTIAALGRDIEESGKLLQNMTEVVRKGILEAELQLQKANEEKLVEEGMLRQLPVVGSVLNWFSPIQSSIKGRTFSLAAGSLDSTEVTYSTKAQADRPSLQDTPISSSKKLPGQKLFRRAGVSTDSTETSCTQAEATFQEENPTGIGSSINPPISPPTPEMPHHTSGDLVPEKNLKSSSEIDDLEASEEMHPEGQEAEGSTR